MSIKVRHMLPSIRGQDLSPAPQVALMDPPATPMWQLHHEQNVSFLAGSCIQPEELVPSTLNEIVLPGDVSPNPGPRRRNPVRFLCGECGRSVRNNQEAILCANCNTWSYATCPGLWKKTFQYYLSHPHIDWECHACALPYRNHSFLLHPSDPEIKQVDEQEHNSLLPSCDYENDFLSQHAANMERSPHILNIGQLNICGLRNKVDEVRIM